MQRWWERARRLDRDDGRSIQRGRNEQCGIGQLREPARPPQIAGNRDRRLRFISAAAALFGLLSGLASLAAARFRLFRLLGRLRAAATSWLRPSSLGLCDGGLHQCVEDTFVFGGKRVRHNALPPIQWLSQNLGDQ